MDSAIDNPMVLPGRPGRIVRQLSRRPLGIACDLLRIASAQAGAISERRTDRLLDANRSHGLPPFLADESRVDSGMMIAQYAGGDGRRQPAACGSGFQRHGPDQCHTGGPCIDGLERGPQAAPLGREPGKDRHGRTALRHQGLDLRAPLAPSGDCCGAAGGAGNARGPSPGPVAVAPELAAVERIVREGEVLAAVEKNRRVVMAMVCPVPALFALRETS